MRERARTGRIPLALTALLLLGAWLLSGYSPTAAAGQVLHAAKTVLEVVSK